MKCYNLHSSNGGPELRYMYSNSPQVLSALKNCKFLAPVSLTTECFCLFVLVHAVAGSIEPASFCAKLEEFTEVAIAPNIRTEHKKARTPAHDHGPVTFPASDENQRYEI